MRPPRKKLPKVELGGKERDSVSGKSLIFRHAQKAVLCENPSELSRVVKTLSRKISCGFEHYSCAHPAKKANCRTQLMGKSSPRFAARKPSRCRRPETSDCTKRTFAVRDWLLAAEFLIVFAQMFAFGLGQLLLAQRIEFSGPRRFNLLLDRFA